MAEFDAVSYLAGKGLHGKSVSGGREIVYACFMDCAEPDDSRKKKWYLNPVDGLFQCKVCQAAGGSYMLQKHFGDEPRQGTTDDAFMRRRILDAATDVGVTILNANDDVLMYLLVDRGLSPETIIERKLGFVAGGWSLVGTLPEGLTAAQVRTTGLVHRDGPRVDRDFFYRHLLIPYLNHGHTLQIRGRAWGEISGGKYLTGPGEIPRLYNGDSLEGAEDVIITEGEMDCMILAQALAASTSARARKIAVVALPGVSAMPEEFDDVLSAAKRIFIGLDSDAPGIRAAEKLKERIGPRARIILLPSVDDRKCDWSEWLLPATGPGTWKNDHPYAGHDWRDVLRLLSTAAGKRVYSIAEAGESSRTRQFEHDGILTGHRFLDATIKPGLLPGQVVILLAKTGAGKGHPLTTEVPTPLGFRSWGDLHVGDEVFASDGTPTAVTGIYDRGVLPTFRVTFSDASSVDVDGDHLWSVSQRAGKKREWRSSVLSTQQLMDIGLHHGRAFRFIVPMGSPAQYPEAQLPIGPYTLGALIANGWTTGTSAVLTTPDEFVIERIRSEGYEVIAHIYGEGGCPRFCIRGVIGEIRKLGLDVLSAKKHIPEIYLTASIEQRLALLQGLMDGDGGSRSKQSRRSANYFTGSRELALDVIELVASLGGTGRQTWIKRPDRNEECKIAIMPPAGMDLFTTPRRPIGVTKYATVARRAIIDISQIDDQPIRCISVAAADQLYQVGRRYIVTHNTLVLCNLCYNMREKKILYVTLEMTREEIYDRLRRIFFFHHPYASDEDVDTGLANIYICDENRLGSRDLSVLAGEYAVEADSPPDVVMVDYLGYYARGFPGNSPYEKVGNAVMELKAEAKTGRFVVICPAQVNRGAKPGKPIDLDDARDAGQVEETADFLLALFRPDDALQVDGGQVSQQPTGKLKLSLLKSRHGGVGQVFSLQMDLLALAIVDDGGPAAKKAQDHNYMAWRGHDWDYLRAIETAPRQLPLEGLRDDRKK